MAGQMVVQPDMILWATGWLRARLAERGEAYAQGVVVTHVEPSGPSFPKRLVVLGDSGSVDGDLVQAEFSLRVSTLAGTPELPKECVDLARLVHGLFRTCAGVEAGNPVAAVVQARGPMSVPEQQQRARRMSVFDLSIVGDVVSL